MDALLEEAVQALQRQRRKDTERLDEIRARIRRSLNDPRPDMSLEEVEAHMEGLFAQARDEHRHT